MDRRQPPHNSPLSAKRSLDVTSDPSAKNDSEPETPVKNSWDGSFLGIHFDCCQTYRQIYRNRQGTAYVGKCPKCGATIRVPIGSGGTSSRFFSAG